MKAGTTMLSVFAIGLLAAMLPDDAAGQWSVFGGVSGSAGTLPNPFAAPCSQGDRSAFTAHGGYAGVRWQRVSVQANYSRGSQIRTPECAFIQAPVVPGLPIERRGYQYSEPGNVAPLTFRAGYALRPNVTFYGGGGYETTDRNPLALAALAVHGDGPVRITGGVEIIYMAAHYQHTLTEFTGPPYVRSDPVVFEDTRHWKPSVAAWIGLEVQHHLFARRSHR